MSVKSARASGERMTVRSGDGIGIGALSTSEANVSVASHLLHTFGRKGQPGAPIELIEPRLQLGPKLLDLVVSFVEQAHRLAHDFARIGELAARDPLPDASFDVGGKLDA